MFCKKFKKHLCQRMFKNAFSRLFSFELDFAARHFCTQNNPYAKKHFYLEIVSLYCENF